MRGPETWNPEMKSLYAYFYFYSYPTFLLIVIGKTSSRGETISEILIAGSYTKCSVNVSWMNKN